VPERTTKDYHTWPSSNVRYGRREEEWVTLHEPNDANAKGSSTQLLDSESEKHMLGNEINVTQTIWQRGTQSEGGEERGGRRMKHVHR
jgi:hypothetical protein